ncbi:cytochrome b561 and DOMON domain-containing protein At3g07570-like [Typha latifolia]|uniref:cytochrome b561 and DOMON domain-containing protein At3g07570-like n=1 Tax=Typha latifolia TaxID=4733 RepID=UPI003C2D6377
MKSSLISLLFFCFLISLYSSAVNCQQSADSCNSNLSGITHLIPFNTSNLHCFTAWSSQDFILRYGNASSGVWSYVVSAPDTSSYVAVGFSSKGKMVGSSAVAGWITPSGPGVVKQYYLGGESSGDCPQDQGSLKLVKGMAVIVAKSSRLYLAFQITVDQPAPYLIYAVGPKNKLPSSPDYYLAEHRTMSSASVDYTAGGAVSDAEDDESSFSTERRHGLLALLGWGVLMPLGVMAARYFKQHDPQWFYSHISLQGIGFALGLAGIILGFGLDDDGIDDVDAHKALGIAILVFGSLQVLAFLARPDKTSKVRKYWNWYHHYIGRTAIACAIANIFFGLAIASEEKSWSVGYGVFLAVWVIASVILEVRRCMNNE